MNENEAEIKRMIGAIFVAFLIGTALFGMFLLSAPRTMNGNGMIPPGCDPLMHMKETLFGPGKDPVCFIPGAAVPPGLR